MDGQFNKHCAQLALRKIIKKAGGCWWNTLVVPITDVKPNMATTALAQIRRAVTATGQPYAARTVTFALCACIAKSCIRVKAVAA